MPLKTRVNDEILNRFIGGQLELLLRRPVGGLRTERYCGEILALRYESPNLYVKFRWLAASNAPDAPGSGLWAYADYAETEFEFPFALWDISASKSEEGCLELLHGSTGSAGTLRLPASAKALNVGDVIGIPAEFLPTEQEPAK